MNTLPEGQRGFTLVEALIAVTLGSIVVAAAFSLFNSQQEATRVEELRLELQQNSRYALDFVRRDLQEAGEGMDPSTEFGVVAMGDHASGDPDTLYVLYVEPGAPPHGPTGNNPPGGMEDDSVKLKVTCDDPVDDLDDGDFLYLAKGSARGVARVDGVDRVTTRSCGGSVSGADSIGYVGLGIDQVEGEGHGWIWEGAENDDSAAFKRVLAAVYYIDDSDAGNPRLMRATRYRTTGGEPGWDGRVLAEGVSDLQTGLILANGDTVLTADGDDSDPDNDYDDVNSVIVRLRAVARRNDPDLAGGQRFARDYAITVTPRNQLYTRNLQGS